MGAAGGDKYRWLPITNVLSPNSASTLVVPSTTTSYQVIIEDNVCHVEDSLFATVNVNPKPILNIQKSNDIDCNKAEAQLIAYGASHYIWNSVTSLSNENIPNPIASPRQTSTYYVTGFSNDGCSSIDSIEVKVLTFGKNEFYLPSAFTPNDDNLNECFGIKYWGSVTEFSMKIYNRWGQLIYTTDKPEDCWNGKYKGVDQPVGVYVYIISAKTLCGDVSKKGILSLIR